MLKSSSLIHLDEQSLKKNERETPKNLRIIPSGLILVVFQFLEELSRSAVSIPSLELNQDLFRHGFERIKYALSRKRDRLK